MYKYINTSKYTIYNIYYIIIYTLQLNQIKITVKYIMIYNF